MTAFVKSYLHHYPRRYLVNFYGLELTAVLLPTNREDSPVIQ